MGRAPRVGKNFKRVYDFFAAYVEKKMIYPERNCKNLYSCGTARGGIFQLMRFAREEINCPGFWVFIIQLETDLIFQAACGKLIMRII
jgi:hypothetical protein